MNDGYRGTVYINGGKMFRGQMRVKSDDPLSIFKEPNPPAMGKLDIKDQLVRIAMIQDGKDLYPTNKFKTPQIINMVLGFEIYEEYGVALAGKVKNSLLLLNKSVDGWNMKNMITAVTGSEAEDDDYDAGYGGDAYGEPMKAVGVMANGERVTDDEV